MANATVVDRTMFCKALEEKGFVPDETAYGELVYIRQHHMDPSMYVKIYTTLSISGGNTRPCGTDAIRVMLIFKNARTNRSGCLFSGARVHRVGTPEAIIERTIQRAREAYKVGVMRVRDNA